MSGARLLLNTRGTFVKDPEYTLFSSESVPREEYIAGTFEIPFDSVTTFGGKASVLIPQKGDVVRRVNIRSKLPVLYSPLGPGYVYPLYTDQVDGSIYVQTNTLAIQPGDFVGYFNTQFLNAWATNFVGTSNISVAYDATQNKFVFTSPTYANIFFQNEQSASFWGFDIRTPDLTVGGYPAFRFTSGTLTAPLTLVQAGWIRGFTPPPATGFSYVDSVACKLIKEATLTIGGQTIDRLTSERFIIEDDLGLPYENQAGLTILEGKNDSSAITAQREYYTRLTFNTDTISMNALEKQDVRVNVEFEKFENLPTNYISSNGFLDGASYVTSNLEAITGDAGQNFAPVWMIGWKNYVIMGPLLNNSFRFYNQDTGTWYKWTPGSGSGAFITTNGGTIYGSSGGTLRKADIATILASSTTPWTSGYNPFSSFPTIPWGIADNTIKASYSSILTDARYVYMWYQVNYFIIGSTYTSIVSGSLDGTSKIWTITYRFYNKTGSLSASDQTALSTFWTSYCGAFTNAVITGYADDGSDLLVTADLTYDTPQPSGNQNIPGVYVHNNMIWVRYDSTASFTSASSYTWALTSGGLPASVKDALPGYNTIALADTAAYFKPTFDGRYIYFPTSPNFIAKLDTQNFLSTSAYTQVSGALLSPNPVFNTDGPFISDGQYLYPSSSSVRGSKGTFSRYDSTKAIDQQASWQYYTGDTLIRANNYEFSIPCGFDGKYVYFYTGSVYQRPDFPVTDFSRITAWHKYDTTKPFNSVNSWEWIDFRPGNITIASNGSSPQITLLAHRTDLSPTSPYYQIVIRYMRFIIGSRYIYITEGGALNNLTSLQDFVQYNPITMPWAGTSFPSSTLVKYEIYNNPPPTNQVELYGQTDLNKFTIRQGRTTESFQLRFLNPVREIWVVVDSPGVVSRFVLRLNNEILVDDDQITTRYQRAFETHTTMPTSSNVNVYSFSFDPEKLSPSGTLNMSRIAYPTIDVTLASAAPTDLELRVYSKSFNVLGYQGGLGGLLFNSAL